MDNGILRVKCAIVRGGTSKAVFIMENDLPQDQRKRDRLILALYGSPSLTQLDGLGGADPTTSKLAIIGPPTHPDADVDYTHGQVSMQEAFVDYGGNCGNISSAVGPFAIHSGLVRAVEPVTDVRIHLKNSGHILTASVPVADGQPCVDGDCAIAGVPGTAARIDMDWSRATGCTTGKLLPTGNAKDVLPAGGKDFTVSVVDGGNVAVFVRAEEFGLHGTETPGEMNNNPKLLDDIEELRGRVCEKIGLVDHWEEARSKTPYNPFFMLLRPPVDYAALNGAPIAKGDVDLVARAFNMQIAVKAYPGTIAATTGCAARIKGSIVNEIIGEEALKKEQLNFGHPTGIMSVISIAEDDGSPVPAMKKLSFVRTARILMEGYGFVRSSDV